MHRADTQGRAATSHFTNWEIELRGVKTSSSHRSSYRQGQDQHQSFCLSAAGAQMRWGRGRGRGGAGGGTPFPGCAQEPAQQQVMGKPLSVSCPGSC